MYAPQCMHITQLQGHRSPETLQKCEKTRVEKSLGVGYNVILFTQKLIELRGKAAKLQRSQISNNSMLLSFIYHVYNIC